MSLFIIFSSFRGKKLYDLYLYYISETLDMGH